MTGLAKRKGDLCACGCGTYPRTSGAQYCRGHRPKSFVRDRLAQRTVKQRSGCWEWTGYVRANGYGEIGTGPDVQNHGRNVITTHRAAWIITFGEIPKGLCVLHRCDNRICVRPSHLFLGTVKDNYDDMVAKGRDRKALGIDSSNGRLTWDQVQEIRRRYIKGVYPARGTGSSSTELAKEFAITRQYVGQLCSGLWRQTV